MSLFLMLFCVCSLCFSQRPKFQKWNIGLVEGISPLNAYSGLPTLSGHFRNWSVEISPYAFNMGLGATYHCPVLTMLKKLHFTIDGMAFFAGQNGNYFVTFPSVMHMENKIASGIMAGPSVYFLKRFSVQALVGLQYIGFYGTQELPSYQNSNGYFYESGAISLQFRLFKQFEQ